MNKKNKKAVLLAVAFGVLGLAAFAEETVTADDLLEFDEAMAFGVEINEGQPSHTIIEVWREPLLAGTHEVTAAAKSKCAAEPLLAVRYLVADDDNGDGTVQTSEYVLMASATAVVEGAWNVARCPAVVVSASKDAYRVETVWDGAEGEYVSADTVIRNGLLKE